MLCNVYQRELSKSLDAGEALPPELAVHVATCDACRKHYESLTALEGRLRQSVPPEAPLSDELRERIRQSVAAASVAPAVTLRRRLVPVLAGLAAAACVALAVAYFLATRPAPLLEHTPVVKKDSPNPLAMIGRMRSEAFGGLSLRRAGELAASPMEEEMRRVANDARAVGTALLAHLPTNVLASRDQ